MIRLMLFLCSSLLLISLTNCTKGNAAENPTKEVAKEQEARQQAAINQQTATEAVSAGVESQLKGQQ